MDKRTSIPLSIAGVVFWVFGLNAQGLEPLSVHGYAGWAYARTNGNNYLLGSEEGEYGNVNYAFLIAANPYERLRITTSVEFRKGNIGDVKSLDAEELEEELEVELDFAFAEWQFSDTFRLRVGQVKFPFGIYGEILDVGTVRPLITLSPALYGPGMVVEGYDGIGVTGTIDKGIWSFGYDLYFGGIESESDPENPAEEEEEGAEEEEAEGVVREVLGGRLNVHTPIEGLMFGASAFSGTTEHVHDGLEENKERRDTYGLHSEFSNDVFSIRGEYARVANGDIFSIESFYVETSYYFNGHWQAAFRYDNSDLEFEDFDSAPSLLEHREVVLGLNYWFTSNFVLKASYHNVDGNRFSLPESLELDNIEKKTNMFVIGTQFSF